MCVCVCCVKVTVRVARAKGDSRVGVYGKWKGGKERYRRHMAVCVPRNTAVLADTNTACAMCHVLCHRG